MTTALKRTGISKAERRNTVDKTILIEYADMIEEIKEIRRRIRKLEDEIANMTVVSDTVKGTRKDGTIGSIKVTGFPFPLENKKKALLNRYRRKLEEKEEELLELTIKAEEYIESIPKSELRIMFRFYNKKKALLNRYRRKLEEKEEELLELTIKAEEYIESIPKSELRIMFRFYFLDGKTYVKTAMEMNSLFPERRIKYTEDNVKKKIQRFFKNVPLCPEEKC